MPLRRFFDRFKSWPRRRQILLAVALLLPLVALYEWRKDIYNGLVDARTNAVLSKFAASCLAETPAAMDGEKIKILRHCLNLNTHHDHSQSLGPVWKKKVLMAQWLVDYNRGARKDSPPMECSYRARTLVRLLETEGIDSHILVVVRNEDNFYDHVVVEALNPDTGAWEVHDPTYDINYISKDKRLMDMKSLLSSDLDAFTPCNFEGRCDWDFYTRENTEVIASQGYWNAAYRDTDKTLYVSKDRFDETAKRPVYEENLSYCEWRPKWCRTVVHLP